MNRLCLAVLFIVVALPVAAQNRVEEIWDTAANRMSNQNDKWFKDGDFPKCIQSLRMLNLLFPKDEDIATNLGWLLESTEQQTEALAVYVRFRNQNPTDPNATYPEANFYFMKKAYAKVPPLLEKSIKRSPTPHANTYRILAHSYDRLGRLTDAKRVWQAYLKINPSDEAAKANLRKVENKIKDGK
ncbi:MAG: hypothetical protein KF784_04195 [Fimbriimonadaceae bacterium]|nr:hypothetical protein [Fimbriimonadaceae bacterium]